MKTRSVEIMYQGDKEYWQTITVDIPADTPSHNAECVAIKVADKVLAEQNIKIKYIMMKADSIKVRSVEMYYGTVEDRQWDTMFVDIPADTPDDLIEKVSIDVAWRNLVERPDRPNVAFIGVYHIDEECECAECQDYDENDE